MATTNIGFGRCTRRKIWKPAVSSATPRKSSPKWPPHWMPAGRSSACAAAWPAIAMRALVQVPGLRPAGVFPVLPCWISDVVFVDRGHGLLAGEYLEEAAMPLEGDFAE